MHEGDSSNTPSDLHPIVQTVNAVIIYTLSVNITTCSRDHLGFTQYIIVSACQPAVLPSFHIHSNSSPSGKAASEDVPMEDNRAYGIVSVYDIYI